MDSGADPIQFPQWDGGTERREYPQYPQIADTATRFPKRTPLRPRPILPLLHDATRAPYKLPLLLNPIIPPPFVHPALLSRPLPEDCAIQPRHARDLNAAELGRKIRVDASALTRRYLPARAYKLIESLLQGNMVGVRKLISLSLSPGFP
ncbi:hypothetical protein B0H10DRAFT_2196996 [Mycena sp. CBHHK59/15]|nr:hypothetical protein B0H10DRAFT_2196996 [Mycena sp. CBHHK59/15]